MKTIPRVLIILLFISFALKGDEKAFKPKDINEISFEKRAFLSPYTKESIQDLLVFPRQYYKRPGKPYILPKGNFYSVARQKDPAKLIWRTTPLKEKHSEYLIKRKELNGQNKFMNLINWCLQNKLNDCAAYEIETNMLRIWNFQKKEYKPYLKKWLPLADKYQINYSFALPFKGEWYVIVDKSKHHRLKAGAAYAFDIIKKVKGQMTKKRIKNRRDYKSLKLNDYYSWDQEIIAQADGIVTQLEGKNKDNPIGVSGGFNSANYVTVYYGAGISGFYAHLKQGSIKVKLNQRVKKGDVLGLVGNSGASGSPHLHFTMIDSSGLSMKGRFNFQMKSGNKWKTIRHKDLIEGKYIKNLSEK